jgi:hypothetical protein
MCSAKEKGGFEIQACCYIDHTVYWSVGVMMSKSGVYISITDKNSTLLLTNSL